MKKLLSTLTVLSLSLGIAAAGGYGKNTIDKGVVPASGCDDFGTGFEFSGFVAGAFPDSGDGEIGGGASIGYFFTENVGLETSYTVAAFESTEHIITANLVYRLPIKEVCIAPYVLLGGGLLTNSSTDGLWDLGAGLDFRGFGNIGIFVDGTYNWVDGDRDFTLVRGGIRIPF